MKSVTVVLSGLLVSAGMGSFVSNRLVNYRFTQRGMLIPFFTGTAIFLYALFLILFLNLGLQMAPLLRSVFALLIIFPLGFSMGVPFPLGLSMLNRNNPTLIPWAWGANGCASVTGSVLAVMIALKSGFSLVFVIASSLYLLAGLWLSRYRF